MTENKISENLKNFNKLVSDEVSPALKDFIKKQKQPKKLLKILQIMSKNLKINKMTLGQKLAPKIKELATTTLEFSEHKPYYPDDSLLDASLIFQSVLMDKMNDNQNFDDMPFEQQCEMAEKCGEDFRKLVHIYTNIDLWDLAKKRN